ncbi:MAG: tRNA (adenosine(37)-N6)-threonylcarbamoyltransferase complex transferase subunit TsaD [Bacteroidetes bacterium]|nr:tRNA (adenosine(37)-N6)-threonylcarbamoyltransferase complex transferase subunit TsaD [Bacteroidota bacterium]MCW5894098.1 tRNA (adenosine(37)-N6)-threonylcarbamoyltransferase complex transferase subunit TsaD [Bacteroidota bacterium]
MVVLGIETSCDETSAAVLENGVVKSNVISSQFVHAKYGGVVPELASRAHQRMIIDVVEEALQRAGISKDQLSGVAATQGPGLVGALLVGLNFAKATAYGLNIPFVGVNHMEGHLYSVFLEGRVPSYPFVSLIVSGGHSMLVHVREPFQHAILGQTRDDAAGEAFDKVAKMLGLGYPGGPVIDKRAVPGNPSAIKFPRTFLEEGSFDFSFSGVKTAVLYYLKKNNLLDTTTSISAALMADICASFQDAVVDVLVGKTLFAADEMNVKDIAIAGGVSANSRLRKRMSEECERKGCRLFYPKLEYCMDNGAMIGYVGWMKLVRGETSPYELSAVANLELA